MKLKQRIEHLYKQCSAQLDRQELVANEPLLQTDVEACLQTNVLDFDAVLSKLDLDPLTDHEITKVKYLLESRPKGVRPKDETLVIKADEGSRAEPWLQQSQREWKRWENYKEMLRNEGKPETVILEHERAIDQALELTGDPLIHDARPTRKGLVMGNVQSGKTLNFIGLINKAIDAGYQTIVVLGGHMNELRSQAQIRVQEGLIHAHNRHGRMHEVLLPNIVTTPEDDFTPTLSRQPGSTLMQTPHLYVVKKMPGRLDHLLHFFEEETRRAITERPFLLIDDEADYASINTKQANNEVTRTNGAIRKLLGAFRVSTYIAYTATPFANVFIPFQDQNSETELDELFPADFMIKMPIPDTYTGQDFYFADELPLSQGPCRLLDADWQKEWLKLKHKKTDAPNGIHETLQHAILAFVLVIAIRNLRGHRRDHNTMLVNVSRFNDVQNRVAANIQDFMRQVQDQLQLLASMGEERACGQSTILRELRDVLNEDFSDCGQDFSSILKFYAKLEERFSGDLVEVQVVNGIPRKKGAPKLLDYNSNEEEGLWVIAVGGIKLSRGLTLEGLSVSYFYRNALAYDTLTQMCRWFGYRPQYEDLCRLYLLKSSYEHYFNVARAIRGLYEDLRTMQLSKGTPRDFGLRVRNSETALTITAKNKMGTGTHFQFRYNLWSESVDGLRIFLNDAKNSKNYKLVLQFLRQLKDRGARRRISETVHSTIYEDAPYDLIGEFIDNLDVSFSDLRTRKEIVKKALEGLERSQFNKPKVLIMSRGTGRAYPKIAEVKNRDGSDAIPIAHHAIDDINITMITKKLEHKGNGDFAFAYSPSKLISDSDDLIEVLNQDQINGIRAGLNDDEKMTNKHIRRAGLDSPVLVIYLFRAIVENAILHSKPSVAYSLHFPAKIEGVEVSELDENVSYMVNEVLRNIERDEMDDEVEHDE